VTEHMRSSEFVQPTPSERVLVVDDEGYVREILCRWLRSEGYDCEAAASAEQAWELLQQESFALVVTDIMMPRKSGMDLLNMVGRDMPDVAVVMVTAADDRRTAIGALERGAYGYVTKPFEGNEIIINVVNALERRRLVMASREYERGLEERVREQTEEIRTSREEIVLRLIAAQEYRHDETGAHIRRIGLGAEAMAGRAGYSREGAEMLRLAAPMHDVGKIGIPDAILAKPGKLTPEEWEVMKRHTTIGAEMLGQTTIPLLELAREIALSHHEKWDGSGYPEGLSGRQVPRSARIVAVLDVYDALVHDRVYRPAMPEDEALAIVAEGRAKHFDPELYDIFVELLPRIRQLSEELPEGGTGSSIY
jgi:putative two-component system response regulator